MAKRRDLRTGKEGLSGFVSADPEGWDGFHRIVLYVENRFGAEVADRVLKRLS